MSARLARAAAAAAALALALAAARPAHAQPIDAGVDAPPDAAGAAAGAPPEAADAGVDAGPTFEPPRALGSVDVPYPAGAPPIDAPVIVTVTLSIDEQGAVARADLVTAPQPPFDDAVLAAARGFRFTPGTYGGAPVLVEITFTHTFLPPPPPPPPTDAGAPALTAVLSGRLIELGTRAAVDSATVTAVVGGHAYVGEGDRDGRFRLALPPGDARITVTAGAHAPFVQRETLAAAQELAVTYYLARDRYDPYEILVVDERRREEVSRITLRGPELQQVPGTFGDPFRVVAALPGVAAVASLLPFPVVRGASPASTGFLLDGARVPLLYHLLSGPSVIHPDFIDEVQFYPGGAPVIYGGYTGGIIDGRTARAGKDEHKLDADANLLAAGAFVRQPVPALGLTATVAGRYGYPGFLLGLATKDASLAYWDYQLRLDGGSPRRGWTVFAYGARDELDTVAADADPMDPTPPLEPSLILGFHRLDLRAHLAGLHLTFTARTVLGYDQTYSQGTDFSVLSAEPSLQLRWQPDGALTVVGGVEGTLHDLRHGADQLDAANPLSMITGDLDTQRGVAALAEALWRPTARWLVRPGVRLDLLDDRTTSRHAIDPRLTVRYQLARRTLADVPADSDDSAIWLKGSLGVYHQPPRFVVPLPGLDLMPLKYGLLRSVQSSLGVEVPLAARFEVSTEAYLDVMDPTIFDLSVNAASVINDANPSLVPTSVVTDMDGQAFIDRLTRPQTGRSYGVEVLLRRAARTGVFGWISYTLSYAERERGGTWAPYDFDRSHLVNVVVGLPLPRDWDLGLRLQFQSGKPTTTTAGYNTARGDGYLRFDLRVDKRAVWQRWLLDFYVDVTNVALLPEEVSPGATIRYVLPTLGLRGRF